MDAKRSVVGSLSTGEIESTTDDAIDHLDKHQLVDAERLFHRVLQAIVEGSATEAKCAITCLLGLGRLYMKQARSLRHVELEWYRVCLQALASLQQAIDRCDDAAGRYLDTKLQLWLSQRRNDAMFHRKALDLILTKPLLQKFTMKDKVEHDVFDCDWLTALRSHCKNRAERYLTSALFASDESDTENDAPVEEPKNLNANKEKLSNLDLNKIHEIIQNLVKQISADMRGRYLRKKLPENTLRQSISSGLLSMPQEDILTLFEEAIIPDAPGVKPDDLNVDAPAITAESGIVNSDAPEISANENQLPTDASMENQDNGGRFERIERTSRRNFSIEITRTWRMKNGNVSSSSECHISGGCRSQNATLIAEGVNDVTEESTITSDNDEVQNEVLTMWRRYKEQCPLRLPAPPYKPTSSVQTPPPPGSPVTSVGSPPQSPSGVPLKRSPLSHCMLDQALAMTLIHVADRIPTDDDDETKQNIAYELYKYGLTIYQETGFSIAQARIVACVLKQLGLIDCRRGDLAAGSEIVHEAIDLFVLANIDGTDDDLGESRAWFELGNAYVENHCREGALLYHILELVKREIELPDADDDAMKPDLSKIHESIACYNRALANVGALRRQNGCCHTQFYVSVLTKLGDSSVIVGGAGRERAVLCYEEALCLSRTTLGSASIRDNAHILSMLGTSNFLLEHYPKAVSMFETANVLQQHLRGGDDANFETAFNQTMIGICHYLTKYYYKCVFWCLRAFDVYDMLYVNKLKSIDPLKRWFVVRTLYTLGYSYSTVKYNSKALRYLKLCRYIISQTDEPPERRDIPHLVRVLKVAGDIFTSTDELQLAGEYYSEALESCGLLGGKHSSRNALQNQLLNCLASVRVTTRDYGSAAEYLEQALSHQKTVQSHIASDLVGLLGRLARTYTLAGDVDRAIECASECIDAYDDASPRGASQKAQKCRKAQQLCCLATLYYIKACLSDDVDFDEELGGRSETCFKRACRLCPNSVVSVQYANFLYQRGDDALALLTMLSFIYAQKTHAMTGAERNVAYDGVEQAILPEHLHHELDDVDQSVLDALVFGRFLAILCYKQLNLNTDAEDCLNELITIVSESHVSLNHAILAYSFMELGMFKKAAVSFAHAAALKNGNHLALTNFWICCCLSAFHNATNTMFIVYENLAQSHHFRTSPAISGEADTLTGTESPTEPNIDEVVICDKAVASSIMKDSGYCDSGIGLPENLQPEVCVANTSAVIGVRSGMHESFTCVEEISSNEFMHSLTEDNAEDHRTPFVSIGYASNEMVAQESAAENHNMQQEWTSEEVTLNSQKCMSVNLTVDSQNSANLNVAEQQQSWDITYRSETKMSVSPSDQCYLHGEQLREASSLALSPIRIGHDESRDGSADEDVFDEWRSEEVTIETPPEILDMLRHFSMTKDSASSIDSDTVENMVVSPTGVDEPFTVWGVEDSVQPPGSVFQLINQQRPQFNVTCTFAVAPDTPETIDNNHGRFTERRSSIEFGKTRNTNGVWIEETVRPSTTMAILNFVNGNGENVTRTHDDQNGNVDDVDTASEGEDNGDNGDEVWETWEETVETPPEILRAIMAKQQC